MPRLAALIVLLPVTAFAFSVTSASQEIDTAVVHAEHAAEARSVVALHRNLHRVINCLVGHDGQGFDSAAGSPCMGLGQGALRDIGERSAQGQELRQALRAANAGLRRNDLKSARQQAKDTLDELQKVQAETKDPAA